MFHAVPSMMPGAALHVHRPYPLPIVHASYLRQGHDSYRSHDFASCIILAIVQMRSRGQRSSILADLSNFSNRIAYLDNIALLNCWCYVDILRSRSIKVLDYDYATKAIRWAGIRDQEQRRRPMSGRTTRQPRLPSLSCLGKAPTLMSKSSMPPEPNRSRSMGCR